MELLAETKISFNGYTVVPASVFKHLNLETPSQALGKKRRIQWYAKGKQVLIKILEDG